MGSTVTSFSEVVDLPVHGFYSNLSNLVELPIHGLCSNRYKLSFIFPVHGLNI